MTATIYNLRDFKRKEEKPEPTLDQMAADIMSELFGVPPCYLIDDYCAPPRAIETTWSEPMPMGEAMAALFPECYAAPPKDPA